jgi:hypothetical protein
MTSADIGAGPTNRVVAAALAGSAAASAAVPEADLGAEVGGAIDAMPTNAALAWRWVVGTDALDLYAAQPSSPQWRATCVGAGGALHRASVALAAEGLAAQVALLPEAGARADRSWPPTAHLARLVVAGSVEVTAEARSLYEATEPEDEGLDGAPGDRSAGPSRVVVRDLVNAARAEGVRLRVIRDGDGLVGVLHGPDTCESWLRAGMASSAVRLLARQHGLLATITLALGPTARRGARRPSNLPTAARIRAGWRRIGDREGWLTVGIGTPYLRLRLTR